ncbi:MAG TPA: TlpA disulfide reductase family protein [Niabella sp.]|nr:TlpA disulfide reductase family protein [Niabella sp.]HOZ96051.1 TlpA disulfide reductase family protein [Niabella sp.]HQW13417.1 TlpA disulfide reductase family protein [Niabella sp.]HQX18811.1 TlpA disulfide reductase family protein [Niabella sp.]HRB07850.1 TlpA disulfide reductase family protein [Niabella sp.]
MNRIIFLALCWFIFDTSFCQSIKIKLVDKIGFGFNAQETILGQKMKNPNIYTGFDSLKYKKYAIKRISFYSVQDEVEDMILENVPEDKARAWLGKYRDTSYVLYKPVPKNSIAFLDAVDSKDRIHFIMDANNNGRFDDDKEFIFDTSNKRREYPIVYANFEYYNGKILKPIVVPYRINAYAYLNPVIYSYSDHADTLKSTRLDFQSYKEGVYQTGKNKFVFNLINRHMFVYKKDSFDIVIQSTINKNNINYRPFTYKSSQLLEFNNGRYKIDSISNNTLYLNLVEKTKYEAYIGSTAPLFEGRDIMSGDQFVLREKRKSYLLINFWGSWCYPCIKELPALKDLHLKYKNVLFLSIAADLPKDTAKLKTLIQEKNLLWPQLWVHRNIRKTGVLWDYKVAAFPTTFLIDPDGKIVLRGETETILTEIDQYLKLKKI